MCVAVFAYWIPIKSLILYHAEKVYNYAIASLNADSCMCQCLIPFVPYTAPSPIQAWDELTKGTQAWWGEIATGVQVFSTVGISQSCEDNSLRTPSDFSNGDDSSELWKCSYSSSSVEILKDYWECEQVYCIGKFGEEVAYRGPLTLECRDSG